MLPLYKMLKLDDKIIYPSTKIIFLALIFVLLKLL
jgi:hypothetical protein